MLGIAALEQSEWPPYGKQRFFFEDMVNACSELDLEFFFFSPFDALKSNIVDGWTFETGKWLKKRAPLPQLIYDRAFSAIPDERIKLAQFRQFLKNNSYKVLNPVDMALLLDDKVAFHHYLQKNEIPSLNVFPLNSITNEEIFNKNSCYFIKPISGSGGLGIFVVEKSKSEWILKDHLNEVKQHFESLQLLSNYLSKRIDNNSYFIQPKARIVNFDKAPIDLRVLIQNSGKKFDITGMAVRMGQQGSNVSNLQSGGSALAFEELHNWIKTSLKINPECLMESIKKISFDCCTLLYNDFGSFAEIGLDFLLTIDGPLVMEGNTRPSRWVFNVLADRFKENPEKESYFKNLRKASVQLPGLYAAFLRSK